MFLSNISGLDVGYVMTRLSRYTGNLNQEPWIAFDRVRRFLKGTTSFSLRYTGFPSVVNKNTYAI